MYITALVCSFKNMKKYLNKIIQGNSEEELKKLPENSIDTIITDPPYGLSFMGKKWDYDVPSVELWKECLRVLKPGGTALIFAGSRTQHRMACNVEDAGFVLKDCIMYLYGSGFPKATDISKQLDKRNGRYLDIQKEIGLHIREKREEKGYTIEQVNKFCDRSSIASLWESQKDKWSRLPGLKDWAILKDKLSVDSKYDEVIKRIEAERDITGKGKSTLIHDKGMDGNFNGEIDPKEYNETAPSTPEAKLWNGWKSHGLKPAYEPILVAQKPNDGTYANNALKWGVSGLNIDGGRIGTEERENPQYGNGGDLMAISKGGEQKWDGKKEIVQGRFPANIILDKEAGKMLDEQSGESKSTGGRANQTTSDKYGEYANNIEKRDPGFGDKGGASRFFYCAKASKSERGEGNIHPTIKPLKLMEYLCTLTKTPTGGLVLDPFAGSSTTAIACINTDRDFIMIEREAEYVEIGNARIKDAYKDKQETLF